MKKLLLTIIIAVLLNISANAQVDSTKVENRFAQIEQQLQVLQETYNTTQSELQELRGRDSLLQRSISRLSANNEDLSSHLDSLTNNLGQNINDLGNLTRNLSNQTQELQSENLSIQEDLEDISQSIVRIDRNLNEQREELSGQISETNRTTSQSVSELDEALSKSTLYWIIAVLLLGLLSLFTFIFLRKKVTDNQSSINKSLADTRKDLEHEAIKLDEKLVGVMETQMKIIQEERKAQPVSQNGVQDHDLALKVADEIIRIEKNISRMDEGTKGLKQLSKAVGRIRDNFASNGYEMVDMLNKFYEEGLKASVTFRPDPELNEEQPKITRIIKPQVNYKGVMIQQAQIEVSQPE